MRRRPLLMGAAAMAGFSIACASLPSSAAVIYNGGAPDQGGQNLAQSPATEAMNFVLQAGSNVVSDAHWWGGCFPSTTCGSSPDFQLSFYSDSGGSGPGTLIETFDVGTANQTATGKLIGGPSGWDEYAYSATFAPLTLTAGTQYWFGIQETVAEPSGGWGVETTSSAPGGSQMYSMGIFPPLTQWIFQPETSAFELTSASSVPEPSTWAMMLLGFVWLGFAGHCKAKTRVALSAV